tara:strand:+ start:161 stop:376 length:216 start_codon:yes stop_codon:yes gene_type:complete
MKKSRSLVEDVFGQVVGMKSGLTREEYKQKYKIKSLKDVGKLFMSPMDDHIVRRKSNKVSSRKGRNAPRGK